MITQSLNTNLIPGQVKPRLNVSQYDKSSRTLSFALFNGPQPFNISSGITALIQGTKPDGHGFQYNATVTTNSNIVTATLTQQMTVVAGDVNCEIVLLSGNERLATANFVLSVEPAALNDSAIISDSELPLIIAVATEQMYNSEAWAAGTKNGTAVSSSDPQYHNNSKYYAEQAGSSATTASNKAGEASSSASAASNSATSADTNALKSEGYAVGKQNGTDVSSGTYFHNNAKYYAENAAQSAETAASWSAHPPYIGANGNWYVYNTTTEQYEDSGIDASITVNIADITMLAPDATPYVTNTGTNTDPIFHLFIPRGKGISSITKTGTSGLVDTYTITYSDGATTTFTVTNGKSAYQSAVEGGYPRTEAQFYEELGNFDDLATSASNSATNAAQSASDALNQANRAQQYANFIEPHFVIQNNRLYIKDDAVGEFVVANNRLYMKLVS